MSLSLSLSLSASVKFEFATMEKPAREVFGGRTDTVDLTLSIRGTYL
jgi:hypothetical protein